MFDYSCYALLYVWVSTPIFTPFHVNKTKRDETW